MTFEIKSSAFENEQLIPKRYTCDGEELSPPLSWSGTPAGTKSFALISDDPDAPCGTWVHWVVWNIPPTVTNFAENFPKDERLQDGTMQGMTDSGEACWGSPCPPSGTHRYYFKIYALDTLLSIAPHSDKKALEAAMKGHILAQSTLMGRYARQG